MRTKTLVLSAVLGAAGLVSSFAQVYSVNAVGYVNVAIPAAGGWRLVCNPLDAGTGNNTIAKLIPNATESTFLYKYSNGSYEPPNIFEGGEWSSPNQTLLPGEGAFVKSGGAFTITFVGEVAQGAASNKQLATGFNMTGSLVPQAGKLSTDLKYVADEGDFVYQWDNAGNTWKAPSIFEGGEWTAEPTLEVGEAVFIKAAAPRTWNRNFSVN